MYKKIIFTGALLPILLFFTACSNNVDIGVIGGSDGPTAILVSDNGLLFGSMDTSIKEVPESYEDWFFVDGIIYLNVSDNDSWEDLALSKGVFYCEIKYNSTETLLENIPYGSASILPVGTKIFSHTERRDILLAEVGGVLVPYLLIAEG